MGVTFLAPAGTYTSPATLTTKEISANGTYNASDDNANGYSSVTVNVEGGGGSSDFSTATLTINGEFIQSDLFITPLLGKGPNNEDLAYPQITNGSRTNTIILYKGKSALLYMGNQSRTITVSGNIETVAQGAYIITGDGTITLSD